MSDRLLRTEQRATQAGDEQTRDELEQADQDQRRAQQRYLAGLGRAADRARAALRAAGVPIDALLPADVHQFQITETGHFILKLSRSLRFRLGNHEVKLDTKIEGMLGHGIISGVTGIELGSARVFRIRREGEWLHFDSHDEKSPEERFKIGDLRPRP